MHFNVNWLAVIVAAIASMAFGAAWYTTLSKQWIAAIGKTREQLDASWQPYAWCFAAELVMAYFIALVTPALFGEVGIWTGILAGVHMWLGFVITAMIINHRYQNMPWRLTLIDGGHLLGVLIVQGIVIGLFGGVAPVAP
jgi:hypothetical protein